MKQNDSVKILGLTGGVGSGKSTAAHILEQDHHAFLLLADDIARDLMNPGGLSYDGIVEEFGPEVVKADGTLDRGRLSVIVFQNPERLAKLNSLIHPHVGGIITEAADILKEEGTYPYIVVESAILFDVGYEVFCDEVWYIWARDDVRKARLMENRGYSEEKIADIVRQQKSHEEFLALADVAIENSGTEEELREKIRLQLTGDNHIDFML
ncbi:MAG: dephospho-CoA kinase [Lachnospiraceae bacterium]|nr:dephospho-CoA kinase [Lachnospiraceae bacterium]